MTTNPPDLQFVAVPPGTFSRDYVPFDEADLLRCLGDPFWRIESGQIYKITVKSSDGDTIVPFRPNRAQRRFLRRIWHRNVILKARQLGFTTLISIMWLDHALFNSNQLCVQIAQTREDAEAIYQKKVLTAYDNMPEALRAAKPLKRRTMSQIEICNGSVVKVSSSARSGTAHRLHVSEMGKIGAKFPEKAREIVSGSFPAVPMDGIIIVESTAEGEDGEFKKIVDSAQDLVGAPTLNPKQFRFHFYPWWAEPGYRLTPTEAHAVAISEKEHEYFDKVELQIGRKLDICQRAWWVTTFINECLCDFELMWREFPSTPEEPFQVATDGTYYAEQLRRARESGRIGLFPYLDGFPVNTFWDIGSGDGTAIWLHQHVHGMDRFFAFVEDWEKPYSHFITELQRLGTLHGIIWGTHHLPHDADSKRQQGDRVCSPREELEELKGISGSWIVVPRVAYLIHGVNATRKKFSTYCFDEAGCKKGIRHLARYRKKWSRAISAFSDEPVKDVHTEAADALRQHGQYFTPSKPRKPPKDYSRTRNWRVV